MAPLTPGANTGQSWEKFPDCGRELLHLSYKFGQEKISLPAPFPASLWRGAVQGVRQPDQINPRWFFGSWHKFQVYLSHFVPPRITSSLSRFPHHILSGMHQELIPSLDNLWWNKFLFSNELHSIRLNSNDGNNQESIISRDYRRALFTPTDLTPSDWISPCLHITLRSSSNSRKFRLTLQEKVIMECKSIHSQCCRLHCLSWMGISNAGTKNILNCLTAHPKCFPFIYLSSCIFDWDFLHNRAFFNEFNGFSSPVGNGVGI